MKAVEYFQVSTYLVVVEEVKVKEKKQGFLLIFEVLYQRYPSREKQDITAIILTLVLMVSYLMKSVIISFLVREGRFAKSTK